MAKFALQRDQPSYILARIGYNNHMLKRTQDNTKQNTGNRLLAIGDIHGCVAQLRGLLQMIAPQQEDQIVFLGDYVDRGPNSAEVVDLLLKFREEFPKTVFLRGNHEQMFLDFLTGEDQTPFLLNGGAETMLSYQHRDQWPIPHDHHVFIENLPLYFETDDFIFVHAGLRPGIPLEEQSQEDLLWIRKEFLDSDYDWGKPIVFGHTPFQSPRHSALRIGLDTGCVYGRTLTCCEVRTRKFWQA